MRYQLAATVLACLSTVACATAPENIAPQPILASTYDAYDCPQIKAELVRVQGRLQTVVDMQGKQARHDKLLTSAIIFSPAMATIMLVASKDLKKEVGDLKGQYIALSEASAARKCQV